MDSEPLPPRICFIKEPIKTVDSYWWVSAMSISILFLILQQTRMNGSRHWFQLQSWQVLSASDLIKFFGGSKALFRTNVGK